MQTSSPGPERAPAQSSAPVVTKKEPQGLSSAIRAQFEEEFCNWYFHSYPILTENFLSAKNWLKQNYLRNSYFSVINDFFKAQGLKWKPSIGNDKIDCKKQEIGLRENYQHHPKEHLAKTFS